MARAYYIVAGAMAQKPFRRWRRLVDPNDPSIGIPYTLIRLEKSAMRVVFCGGPAGNLLLCGCDEAGANRIVEALEGYLALEDGWIRGDADLPPLYRLGRVPKREWDDARLEAELQSFDPDLSRVHVAQLRSGTVLGDHQQHYVGEYVPRILQSHNVHDSLKYFVESRRTFNGHMSGSYYQFHYRHDRRSFSARQLRSNYMQHRPRYESAFLSSFKALERLLETSQIRKAHISPLLDALGCPSLRAETEYRRRHEIFRDMPEHSTCAQMVEHFLDIRNVVAAHANRSPPKRFSISEDSIYEIQLFLSGMYYALLGPVREYEIPSYGRRRR